MMPFIRTRRKASIFRWAGLNASRNLKGRGRNSWKITPGGFWVVKLIGIAIVLKLVLSAASNYPNAVGVVVGLTLIFLPFYTFYFKKCSYRRKFLLLEFSQIDSMTGHDFERYVGELMKFRGFSTEVTKGSGDNGVDVLATQGKDRWAIQCKRQEKNVSRHAISDAVAATNSTMFKCNKAMVVTNQRFTKAAIQYAKSTGCELVDREVLSQWIAEAKRSSK